MYPWEHAAVAYLLWSGASRWHNGTPPAGWPVLVVLLASQLPDLIDKPLAWQFGVVSSGRSLGHAAVIAVPLAVGVFVVARRAGRSPVGGAFAVGYLAHLATDVSPRFPGGAWDLTVVLWPFRTADAAADTAARETGAAAQTGEILGGAYPSLLAPDALLGLGLVGLAIGVWLVDGRPGCRELLVVGRWPASVLSPLRQRRE
ncbi:metal-dependent hydrolase [Natrialbaceae archaeon GCM10025810]|uniref:metal-dependent hydrolase n=1 Tax=Halovalidus salilacus TaxID=3075124 RepID=UPI0036147DEB